MTRYQAYIEIEWEEMGLAQIVVTRLRDDGVADYANFLVDIFCLGVKDAFAGPEMSEDGLREELIERLPEDFRQPIHPACAKKLIEGAVAFAESLGFSPHRDYRKARKILSGIDASACPRDFTYGRDGRPFYVRGQDDSDERVKRVCAVLEARFGPDGFDYEDPGEEELDPIAVREALMDFLDAEPPEVPRFYFMSGAVTALLLCPDAAAATPLKILDLLWAEPGRAWANVDEMQEFSDFLMTYWNALNDVVLGVIAPNANPEDQILDIWKEDFPDKEGGALALVAANVEWAQGFLAATQRWPEMWRGARNRPDLAPHWEIIGWWAEFVRPENRDRIAAKAQAPVPRTFSGSINALARALRRPLPA